MPLRARLDRRNNAAHVAWCKSTAHERTLIRSLNSAEALSSSTSGSGTSSQSQSAVTDLSLLGCLVAADVVKSISGASCSGSTASVTGSSELVGLVAAGQQILVSNPNLSISLPGGISLIVNEQTRSPSGGAGPSPPLPRPTSSSSGAAPACAFGRPPWARDPPGM
jgi:hypothetical protein